MAAAAGVTSGGGGGAPLAASVSLSGGQGPFNVSGASGDLFSFNGSLISTSASGGTPSYSGFLSLAGDPSGKLAITVPSPGINTVGWSGLAINEVEVCYLEYDVTDAASAHVSSRYPPVGQTILIKRTS